MIYGAECWGNNQQRGREATGDRNEDANVAITGKDRVENRLVRGSVKVAEIRNKGD